MQNMKVRFAPLTAAECKRLEGLTASLNEDEFRQLIQSAIQRLGLQISMFDSNGDLTWDFGEFQIPDDEEA